MLNKYYQNIGIKGFIGRYGFWNALKRGIFIANPFHIIKDYEIKKVLWQKKALQKIKKYLAYQDEVPEGLVFNSDLGNEEPIWVFWNSGFENAPDIVKACLKNLKKYGNRRVIELDENNVSQYVIFPEYINKKVSSGNIPMAGYTDLLRFALLEHYGGTWIDSTVYLSAQIENIILESDFFALQNSMGLVDNPVLYPAWFLHSKKGNEIIKNIRNVAFAYWEKENHIIEYLLPNLIITEVIKNKKVEDSIFYMNTDYSEYLIRCLGDIYNKEKMDWIKNLTNIHKLSYKLDKDIDKFDSFYKHIVEESK